MELDDKIVKNNNTSNQQNGSEQSLAHSELIPNNNRIHAEFVPKEQGISSEHLPHEGGDDPNRPEVRSELIPQVVENAHEKGRHAPVCTDEHTEHTLTIRDVTRLFYEAGVPRSERTITKWCSPNKSGILRLDCCYSEADRKFYVTPMSIDQAIKKERRRFQVLEYKELPSVGDFGSDADNSEHVQYEAQNRSERVPDVKSSNSERVPNSSGTPFEYIRNEWTPETTRTESGTLETEQQLEHLKELQMENFNLKVQLEGQKYLVTKFDELVGGERERHENEKIALVDRLTDARHEIGVLEEKLLQLEAPKGAIRDAEEFGEVVKQ